MLRYNGVVERLNPKIAKKNICRYLKNEYDNIEDPNSIFTDPSFVDKFTGCNLTSSVEKDIMHGFVLLNNFFREKYEVYDVDEIVEELISDEIEDEIISEIIYIETEVVIYLVGKEDGKYGSNWSLRTKIYFGFNLLFNIPNIDSNLKKERGPKYKSKYRNFIGDRYLKWIREIENSDSGILIITGEDLVKELGLKHKIDEKTFIGLKKNLIDMGIKITHKYINIGNGRPLVISMMLKDKDKDHYKDKDKDNNKDKYESMKFKFKEM